VEVGDRNPGMENADAISCRMCFPSVRIRFVDPFGDNGPGPKFSPALFYVGVRPERFEEAFTGLGVGYYLIKKAGITIGMVVVEKKE
jgi:hypothetical protein